MTDTFSSMDRMEKASFSIPKKMNIAWYVCDRWALRDSADSVALLHGSKKTTWRELLTEVNRIGNGLLELGMRKGDRILLRSSNRPELYASIIACMKIGCVPIPSSSLFRIHELEHILKTSRAKLAVVESDLVGPLEAANNANHLEQLLILGGEPGLKDSFEQAFAGRSTDLDCEDTTMDDEAFMLYTSGTTGAPKGIVHAHRWLIAAGEPVAGSEMRLERGDVTLSVSEIAWMYPFGCNFMFPLYKGATVGIYNGRFGPERAFELIQQYRATHFIANPTIYKRMLSIENAEKRWDCASLKMGLSSGEPLSPDLFREWKRRFNSEIYDSMGQSEIHIFCCTRPDVVRMGSMGKPFPDRPPVTIIDDLGKESAVGEAGRIAIRGDHPGLALRYEDEDELWKSRFCLGWYLTGDIGYKDKDGFFWFVSRSDDLIKSRGYLISPKEVEEVLQQHSAVLETAVVGVPDKLLAQRVKAYVVLKPGVSPSAQLSEELREMVLRTIAPFKVPKEIEFLETLPKTATGKILRRELRQRV